jgi:hypothetical protein
LDKAVILARLSLLSASEAHIVAMVNIINISLAIYKVFSKTQLRTVLKSLFINIVPSVMDISGGVGPAYQALLHTAFMEIESRYHRNRLEKLWCRAIRKYVPVPDDMNADDFYHLMQFENGCLDCIREEIPPVGADEFTTLWIAAILSMVSQSMDVSTMMESIPEYLVNLSNEVVESETEVEPEDDGMFYDSVSCQSDDDELFVDSVAYQQPTTSPPPFSSSNSDQAPINSATSRKRKNPFDSELPDDFSQSQSLSTKPDEA